VGYPTGGDNISVSVGVVSRVEPQQYVHGATSLLAIQIDAAINPGNSGGPAIMNNEVVGVAFQSLDGAENIGFIIPVPIIQHFLEDVRRNGGAYQGFPALGISCQALENLQMRKFFGMQPAETGVLVCKIRPLTHAAQLLKKHDVILEVDRQPVGNDGTVAFRNRERISFDYVLSGVNRARLAPPTCPSARARLRVPHRTGPPAAGKYAGDLVEVLVLREGQRMTLQARAAPAPPPHGCVLLWMRLSLSLYPATGASSSIFLHLPPSSSIFLHLPPSSSTFPERAARSAGGGAAAEAPRPDPAVRPPPALPHPRGTRLHAPLPALPPRVRR